jgi:murein DD-endopeptidase MepM/ murein hydrolase activator NlpD
MATEHNREKSRWARWKASLEHTYRLVIMNNETFEEVGSYRLTLLNVYIAISTILVLVAFLVVMAIAFTPLKRYMPGYGLGGEQRDEVERLYREVKRMEKDLAAHEKYTENIRRILVGDVDTFAVVTKADPTPPEMIAEVERSMEEEQLRQEMELQDVGQAAQRSSRAINFSPSDAPLEQVFFTPPLKGEIAAGFNLDQQHYGIDILAPKNTAIKAALDGYIFFSDWTMETGNTLGIQHANNIITFYKHNSVLLKKIGSYVKAGEAVAIIGNTGTLTDGPHLHFELWHRGKPIDPADYIDF